MTSNYVLLQYGQEAWPARFEDLEGRLAFTVNTVEERPNLVLKLIREPQWAQQHPDIMGPSSSFFYLGPLRTPGHFAYGNSQPQPMPSALKRKKDGNPVRAFLSLSGKEYKWKTLSGRLECSDSKGAIVAVWEVSQPNDPFSARLTIKHAGLAVVTELLTTLTLNRLAEMLKWSSSRSDI